jgi:hypothetical protein
MECGRGGKFVSALDWFVPCWFTFRPEIPFAALSQLGTPIASFFKLFAPLAIFELVFVRRRG